MNPTCRLQWIDIAKGITIILMVLGHTSIPKFTSDFIWAFHMPLFFIASGWLTNWNKRGCLDFITHKLCTLLLPFFIYSAIVLIISKVFQIEGIPNMKDWLINGWSGYALWFIPILFIASIISKLLYNFKDKIQRYFLLGCLLIAGYLLSYKHIYLPWALSSVPYATLMIIIGAELKRFDRVVRCQNWCLLLLFISITFCVSHFWRLDMCYNSILPISTLTIGAISGTLMVFMLSFSIERRIGPVSRILSAIGKETFIVVAYSQIMIMSINQYLHCNVIVKYGLLILSLIALKYIKDCCKYFLCTNKL